MPVFIEHLHHQSKSLETKREAIINVVLLTPVIADCDPVNVC